MKEHAALMIRKENQFLFVKRSKNKKTLPGIWAFPSGTKEENETIEETALREAFEELDIKIKVEKVLAIKELSEFGVRLHFLVNKIEEGIPKIKEINEFEEIEWLSLNEFFKKYKNEEIGHGLIYLRNSSELWKEYRY